MSSRSSSCASAVALAIVLLPACTQVRGRKRIQEANELYRRGRYAEAVTLYKEAEPLVPGPADALAERGLHLPPADRARRPGSGEPRAAACALAAFRRLAEVAPKDPRAAELTLQTWFDVQDYPRWRPRFLERRRQAPDDLEAVHGLQDVYFKWGKWPQALEWSKRAAALRPDDAEAQYGVGTFVWQILSAHGGGTQLAGYSPWPEVAGASGSMTLAPPAAAPGDITGEARVALADQGIAYLEKAIARRPRYPEAMTYLALLWRQKSFAFFADPIAWQGAVDEADSWQQRAPPIARAGKVVTGGVRGLSRGVPTSPAARAAHRRAVDRLSRRAAGRGGRLFVLARRRADAAVGEGDVPFGGAATAATAAAGGWRRSGAQEGGDQTEDADQAHRHRPAARDARRETEGEQARPRRRPRRAGRRQRGCHRRDHRGDHRRHDRRARLGERKGGVIGGTVGGTGPARKFLPPNMGALQKESGEMPALPPLAEPRRCQLRGERQDLRRAHRRRRERHASCSAPIRCSTRTSCGR